ncbi:MAG: hypothetical protein M3405_01695 [Acidobacteriota bacterium]|jgi:hypothetical protein|nr:hypothetical protein [Acidobacteriota bacterium]
MKIIFSKSSKIIFPLFLILILSVLAAAQETEKKTEKVDEKTADVSITGGVTAKELKFEIVPETDVKFSGTHERRTEWSSERTNLPETVQPNVIYRNIGIRLKIVSVFADIERIVDEALGKVPPQEKTKSDNENNENKETDELNHSALEMQRFNVD